MTDLAVIMSVYQNDRLSFLKESVQSILDQTFSDFHYYIVFDGPVSSGIDNYIASLTDSRIRHFRLGKNGGLARALNYLLEIVLKNPDYKLIARMDADDVSERTRLEKQRCFLMDNHDIACVGSWYEEIDESGKTLCYRKLPVDHSELRKRYYTRIPFAHPSVMYRRALIETAGFYSDDTILMEDSVLWADSLKHDFKFSNIPQYLLKFRIDRDFYKRRSGIQYGFNFIKTRFKINKSLKFPLYSYLIISFIGLAKMMPSFLIRYSYKVSRRYQK
jgi:glycosyltransferase involved in cell wall biosynthesis